MRYKVCWPRSQLGQPRTASVFVTRDWEVVAASPGMKWAVGKRVELVVRWLDSRGVPWEVTGVDSIPGISLKESKE